MGDYSAERYNPSLRHCAVNGSNVSLHFDGRRLSMTASGRRLTYSAVSGRKINGTFDYSPQRQRIGQSGPIPEGVYWINPGEFQVQVNLLVWERWDSSAWGRQRITIHPFLTTDTRNAAGSNRGGFFIHGGNQPGSAGCIDLATQMGQFYRDLLDAIGFSIGGGAHHSTGRHMPTCQIHLTVKYT